MTIKQLFKLSLIASALSLTACGGGSDEGTPPTFPESNLAPTVSVESSSVKENTTISLAASASDSDGTIASYQWAVTSTHDIELTNANTNTVSFVAPGVVDNDQQVTLSVTVTDDDGATASAQATIDIEQITIPLTITGLATDSPIRNGNITVKVSGSNKTVNAIANESGIFTVDLTLDDSEVDGFVSIIAKGVEQQQNAGLISLLGTVSELVALAGDDNTLTEDEAFSVNVTNITTAKYALAKLENNGQEITTTEEMETLIKKVDFDDVLKLATAIKVAIDKANNNDQLALPEEASDTLALVEDVALMASYVKKVGNSTEFFEAQEEMLIDESLVDKSSWVLPGAYVGLATASNSGSVYHFNDDGTGATEDSSYTWQLLDDTVTITKESPVSYGSEKYYRNGAWYYAPTVLTELDMKIKRLNATDSIDSLLITTRSDVSYPNGEFDNRTISRSYLLNGKKQFETIAADLTNGGIAYLPYKRNLQGDAADKAILNADGTGTLAIRNKSFEWSIENGQLTLHFSENDEDYKTTWTLADKSEGIEQYFHQSTNSGEAVHKDTFAGLGAILTEAKPFTEASATGIYQYDLLDLDYPLDHYWFELHANGHAETKSSADYNNDGQITSEEVYVQYGSWSLNEDGQLRITRVRSEGSLKPEECRYETTEGCYLYHERTWELMGESGNQFSVFHDFTLINAGIGYHDTRILHKVEKAPVEFDTTQVNSSTKSQPKLRGKLSKLEQSE